MKSWNDSTDLLTPEILLLTVIFNLKPEDFAAAKFHLTVDTLANIFSMQELLMEMYCKQMGIDKEEAKNKLEALTKRNRQMIHDIIDQEFGHVDTDQYYK